MSKLRALMHRADNSSRSTNTRPGALTRSESAETTETLVEGANSLSVPPSSTKPSLQYKARDDLWQEAVRRAKLTLPSEQVISDSDRASTLQIIYEEATRRQGEKSHRTIRKSNGKNVSYREIYGKIISSIMKFQLIGDIAIQADAGYAGLPWVVISFRSWPEVNIDDDVLGTCPGCDPIGSRRIRNVWLHARGYGAGVKSYLSLCCH